MFKCQINLTPHPIAVRRASASGWLLLLTATVTMLACSPGDDEPPPASMAPPPATPAEHREGEQLFNANCIACHGQWARGTAQGPPLVHIFYEPAHHGDAAFLLAARNGVVAHHWNFGDMPAQPQVTAGQMTAIIGYIRWLQRTAGIQ